MLGLVVILVEFGRILLGRDCRIQGDLDLLHVGIVEVDRLQAGLAPGNRVEVRGYDIAELTQAFAVAGRFELPALVCQFAFGTAAKRRQRPAQILGAGAHPLRAVALGVIRVQQGGEAGDRLAAHIGLILEDRAEAEILRGIAPIEDRRRKISRQTAQGLHQGVRESVRILQREIRVGFACQPIAQLPGNQRRNSGIAVHQPGIRRHRAGQRGKGGAEGLRGLAAEIQLALRRRFPIEQAGQDLSLFGHLQIDTAQTVENAAVRAGQNQIGIAAHQFEPDVLWGNRAEFIRRFDAEVHRALHRKLRQ